jgi:two-component system cell cycle response regulator
MPNQRQARMELTTERLEPKLQAEAGEACQACLVHIYPSGTSMGRRYPLGDGPLSIGRGGDCDIVIDDPSVSRRHVRLVPLANGHEALDLGSTNGTHVNDEKTPRQILSDGDYLRVGNHIYRYLAGGNVEAAYHEEIHRLVIIDALTDVPNRRHFMEFLTRELARAGRYERALTLILLDIDCFKAINDQNGHLSGDAVLRLLAARIKPIVRAEELLARYGGEEFAVVLPECPRDTGLAAAERIRSLVEAEPFPAKDRMLHVTISLGLATTTPDEPLAVAELIQRADEHLYAAKQAGRNCVRG